MIIDRNGEIGGSAYVTNDMPGVSAAHAGFSASAPLHAATDDAAAGSAGPGERVVGFVVPRHAAAPVPPPPAAPMAPSDDFDESLNGAPEVGVSQSTIGSLAGADAAEQGMSAQLPADGLDPTPEVASLLGAASSPAEEDDAPRVIRVSGAAILRDGKILCARRPEGKNLAGKWEFPGGKLEPGEDHREALAREIREELGCEVEVGDQICTTQNDYEFGVVELVTFWCTLKPGEEPKRIEHAELRWMDPEDMPSLDWAPADWEAVDLISVKSLAF